MWKLDGTHATLDTPEFAASLDLAQPHLGLKVATPQRDGHISSRSEGQILQVHFPLPPRAEDVQDCWTRGADLVVTYSQRSGRQVTSEIYWRLVRSCTDMFGTELILSVQTDLLDASPTTSASSQIPAAEAYWLRNPESLESGSYLRSTDSLLQIDRAAGQGLFVFRIAGSPFSYVEMVHPTDFCSATVHWDDGAALLRWQLFPDSLEKGVIRRARLRGLFVSQDNDLANAVRCFQEFAASPPPLTT